MERCRRAISASSMTGSAPCPMRARAPKWWASSAAAKAIDVRTSEVHLIDAPPVTAVAGGEKTEAPAPAKQLASLEQPAAVPVQKGASSCLSVESDGSHWGFKNGCGYTVQFAYCL